MEQQTVDVGRAAELAQRLCDRIHPTTSAVEAEVAILLAYCFVAEGVKKFPASTQFMRALVVTQRGAAALVKAIEEVERMPDALVRLELQATIGSTM